MNDDIEDIYELSPLQQGILFHTVYAPPESGMYFEQFSMPIDGPVDVGAFRDAWQHVVDRHSVLRTGFHWDAIEKPVQVVHRRAEIPFHTDDWSDRSPDDQRALLTAFLENDLRAGFTLAQPPPIRVALFNLGRNVWQFNTSFHHIVLDGWSVALVFRDFYESYVALSQNQTPVLPDTRPFGDYIAWLQSQDLTAAEQYWRRALSGFKGSPPLPMMTGDAEAASFTDYAVAEIVLPDALASDLAEFARQQQVTTNTLFQGSWAILLATYSAEDDVAFGVTVSGRPSALAGIENMVGLFINTLPARVHVDWHAPLAPWLRQMQSSQFEARQYEYTPLVSIHGWSDVNRERPLFETLVVFENYPVDRSATGAPASGPVRGTTHMFERTNYPLTLQVIPGPPTTVRILYMKGRIASSSVDRMLPHLRSALAAMTARPNQQLRDITLLDHDERQLLNSWNATARAFDRDACVHDLVARQIEASPDAIAIEFGDEQCTYRELDARSAAIARAISAHDARIVGISLERSIEMVVAVLGVLRAGAAYVPFDSSYPAQRLNFMARSSECRLLIARERPAWASDDVVVVDGNAAPLQNAGPASTVSAGDLAYVLFTSGSTGQPKGVAMEHRSLVNLIEWQWRRSVERGVESTLQFAPLNFDVSFQEIFSTLGSGGRLVLISEEDRRDPERLLAVLARHRVTRLFLPYVALQQLAEAALVLPDVVLRLREVITAGEQLKITPAIRKWFSRCPECTLENQYGPTEAHVVSAFTLTGRPSEWPDLPPIGHPIDNASLYVLDSLQRPAPIGVVGQLHIGGVALAREYLNQPELTAERFNTLPTAGRLYATGDLARHLPDGNIEFLGRADAQTKIRGFRVELGEIEAALARHPMVSESVCTVQQDGAGEKRIVAYVSTTAATAVSSSELSAFLKEWLPEYMVPASFVWVGSMPLTPSGKVDRAGLPAWTGLRSESERGFDAPATDIERRIAAMWADILGLERVSARESFFALGGHSLLATRLASRLRSEFEIDFPLRGVFEAPTIAEQAEIVASLSGEADASRLAPIKRVARGDYVAD